MSISSSFNAIVAKSTDALRPLLQEAFEAGRSVGRDEASADLKGKIASLLSGDRPSLHAIEDADPVAPANVARAASGSVKPRIAKLIQDAKDGLTTQDIGRITGFKHNSIRGTLWGLGKDGVAENRGGRWFPKNSGAVEGLPLQPPNESVVGDH
jgi:hypothetical protein